MNINESTTLGSVFGAPGDPNGGIFIGKLSGISGRKMRKRLLYPTYVNSTGKNVRVKNSLNEEHLYNEQQQPVTEADILEMIGEAFDQQTAFKGGTFVSVEPKCLAFPYCNQGAPDKPVRLISGSKEGMCEGCRDYCNHIAEQVGKTTEWVAEGFRQHTLKKLEEITANDNTKVNQLLAAIQPTVEPSLFDKIKDRIAMAVIDPFITYDDILAKIKQLIPQLTSLNESVELVDNKQKQNIEEMLSLKVKNLALQHRKELMEAMLTSPVSECMQSKLQAEGFLPLNEELNGMTVAESLKALMEDDDLVNEMFEALAEGDCDCAKHIKEYVNENFGDEDSEESTEDTSSEEPTSDESGEESTEEPVVAADHDEEPGDAPEMVDEPSADVTDIQPAEEPAPAETGDQVAVDGGGELAAALEAISAAQGEGDAAAKFGHLTQANIALQKALSAATMAMEVGIDGTDTSGVEGSVDGPMGAPAEEPAADGIEAIAIDESVFDGTTLDSSAPAPAPKQRGGATRKTLDADFISKVDTFKTQFLDDLKWNSLKTYYQLSPETQPEDIHTYLTPGEDENGLGFVQRITNLTNDPTGINRMLVNLMNPSKRGYIEKFGAKYDPQFLDGLEDLMSDMFNKYQAIQAMLDGTHSPLDTDDEEGPEGDDSSFAKDDFEDEFKANDDDAIAAQAASAAKAPNAPKVDITPDLGDDDEEEDLYEQKGLDATVLSANKEGAKENLAQAKAAEETQHTEDMKVDELKNQKFAPSEAQKTIGGKMHGMNNALDIDYDQEPSKEYKDRVIDQAKGLAPKDHVNVDHDSTAGQQLIDAAKDRAGENEKQFTSVPDSTIVKDEEKYEVTTAVNEDIERIKKLMTFDVTKLKENKQRQKFDEDKFLTEKVQKKKFL